MTTLAASEWRPRAAAHAARVDGWTAGHRARVGEGRAHPVEEFLFTYYSLRPSQLRRWHPGAGVVLLGEGDDVCDRLRWRWHVPARGPGGEPGVTLDVGAFLADRSDGLRRVLALLEATLDREPRFGCFGLHEWAMVHGAADDRRHTSWPLRLGREGTDRVVERSRLRCTHVDAFRFFTPSARPLNERVPTRESQVEDEQPGCLHATMDLYKWAYKTGPALGSELTAACFALAREVRELDMRASPYDLRALGLEPVRIEEPSGRAEYVARQRDLTARGQGLRARLVGALRDLLGRADATPPRRGVRDASTSAVAAASAERAAVAGSRS